MFFILFIVLIIVVYLYITRNHSYWSKRRVKHEKPIPFFGNHWRNFTGEKSITQICDELYNKYDGERFIGYYRGNIPELIIRDPDLVRQILNVDFNSFFMRGLAFGVNPEVDPMAYNLFHAEGDDWKLLRQRLTTAFTTTKLRNMFPLVVSCAEKLQKVAEQVAEDGNEYDVREMMARFTTDFIGACGFGIEMDSLNDERSEFRELGRKMFNPTYKHILIEAFSSLVPEITSKIHQTQMVVEKSMIDIFVSIRNQRNCKPIGRNDFVDLLLELETNGKIVGDSFQKVNEDGTPVKVSLDMTIPIMTAQLFIFFAAGFETSSSATSFLFHELSFNPDIQTKIQEEIDDVLSRYDNKLCYDAIKEMSLLKRAFRESMRMFPSLGILNRECTKQYTIPGTDITIDPGTKIIIPVQAMQNDERYFEKPEQFDPDRFLPENEKNRHNFVYLPFGEGPRACIGARLGYMQSLAGVAALLHKFTFEPSKSTTKKLEVVGTSNVVQAVKNGVPLKIMKR